MLELIQNYNMDYDQQINTDSLCYSVVILCSYSWFFSFFSCVRRRRDIQTEGKRPGHQRPF